MLHVMSWQKHLKSQLVTKPSTRHDYRADFSEFLQSSAAVLHVAIPWQHSQKSALRCVCVWNCEPSVHKGEVNCTPEHLQHWVVAKTTKSQYPGRNFSTVSSSLHSPRRMTIEPTFENFCNKVQGVARQDSLATFSKVARHEIYHAE